MPPPEENNKNTYGSTGLDSWATWQRLVLAEQERHERDLKEHCNKEESKFDDLRREIGVLQTELAVIKGKAALIGSACGIGVSALIQILLYIVKSHTGGN